MIPMNHSDYRSLRDRKHEQEQVEALEVLREADRLRNAPDKLIREMNNEELDEIEEYGRLILLKVATERARRTK